MLKHLKRCEWSKKLLVFVQILIMCTYILVFVAVINGLAEPLTAFVTGVFALASSSFGFYYWKAKNENMRKYAKNVDEETIDKIVKMYENIGEDSHEKF